MRGTMSYERMYVLHEAPSGITWLRAKEGRRRGLDVHVFCLAGTKSEMSTDSPAKWKKTNKRNLKNETGGSRPDRRCSASEALRKHGSPSDPFLRSFLLSDPKGLSVPSDESQSAANDSVSSALSTEATLDLGGTWRLN